MTDEPEEENTWQLLVAFPDESPSFAHGFQAGQIWEAMKRSDPRIEATVLAENEEVCMRMARSQGYTMTCDKIVGYPEWRDLVLVKNAPAKTYDPVATGDFTVIEGGKADV